MDFPGRGLSLRRARRGRGVRCDACSDGIDALLATAARGPRDPRGPADRDSRQAERRQVVAVQRAGRHRPRHRDGDARHDARPADARRSTSTASGWPGRYGRHPGDTSDEVEREGVARARRRGGRGGPRRCSCSTGRGRSTTRIARCCDETAGAPRIVVVNKSDLPRRGTRTRSMPTRARIVARVALQDRATGSSELRAAIARALARRGRAARATRRRHERPARGAAASARASIARALANTAQRRESASEELVLADLQDARARVRGDHRAAHDRRSAAAHLREVLHREVGTDVPAVHGSHRALSASCK